MIIFVAICNKILYFLFSVTTESRAYLRLLIERCKIELSLLYTELVSIIGFYEGFFTKTDSD